MRALLLAAAALLLMQAPAMAQTKTEGAAMQKSGLTRLIEAELSRFAGPGGPYRAGIYVKNLTTGEAASVNGDAHFETASTFKLVPMVMAYQMQDQKKLDLDKRYTIKASDLRGGSGIFRYHDLGLNPTLRDVITQMVITSDNSATDIMIAQVGGVAKMNEWLKANNYPAFHINSTIHEFFRQRYDVADPNTKLSPEDLFAMMSNIPSMREPRKALIERYDTLLKDPKVNQEMAKRHDNESYWLAVVTPNEMGRLLEGIEKDTIASKGATEEMKRAMRAQQAGTRKVPHFLSVPVAHKTGEVGGVTNDVGMIYAKSGPIVFAFYTFGYTGLASEADDRLGAVARLIVEYFDGPGSAG